MIETIIGLIIGIIAIIGSVFVLSRLRGIICYYCYCTVSTWEYEHERIDEESIICLILIFCEQKRIAMLKRRDVNS